MRVVVDFHGEELEFELTDDRFAGSFRAPEGIPEPDRAAAIASALEQPFDFPPFAKLFVPGDHVAIALDSGLADAPRILGAVLPIIRQAVGGSGEITVVATPGDPPRLTTEVFGESPLIVHDPADRNGLAYLASTRAGRRVYLNRRLTDADVVVPIGEIQFDPILGRRGPWSVLFPELSDQETRREFTAATPAPPGAARLDESFEAGWLLGSQFSIGFVPGRSGFSGVFAGLSTSVRDQAGRLLEDSWRFQTNSRADLVIAGIGGSAGRTGLEELAAGLTTAARLVRHGGKIALLSRSEGTIGPALRRLIEAGEPRLGARALKGREDDEDYTVAVRLNQVLAWADVYLLSALDPDLVEELSMVPLAKAGEAARLAAGSHSCIALSRAELVQVDAADDQ